MHHRTSWWVSELFSSRSVGSSATSRPMAWESLSSSALDFATTATGSSGSGITHGSISSGSSFAESVSPVSARASLATAQMSPAIARDTVRCVLPSGEVMAPTFSSTSWSSWPRSLRKCPDTCTTESGRRVPEKMRTREMRPTYGSVVVLTTSATSGPSGSHVSGACGEPFGAVTGGTSCSSGDGKPCVITSSSSVMPRPVGDADGEHRVEGAAGDGGLEVVDEHLEVDVLATEVAVHQGLVLGLRDDPLDQGVACACRSAAGAAASGSRSTRVPPE